MVEGAGWRPAPARRRGTPAALGLLLALASVAALVLALHAPAGHPPVATRSRRLTTFRAVLRPRNVLAHSTTLSVQPAAGVQPLLAPLSGAQRSAPPTRVVTALTPVATASVRPVSGSPVPALARVPAGWVTSAHTVAVGGLQRSYLLVRAPAQSHSLPVVVVLHGRQMTPAGIERASGVLGVLGPAIAVFPAGYGESWDAGSCCGVAQAAHVDDVTFLETVVRQVLTSQPDANPRRVYLVGYSNGGRMALRMACTDPGAFAGVAAVEAVPAAPCAAMAPLPTVLVASSSDPLLTVPVDGAPKVIQDWVEPTVGATVAQYRQLDGCAGAGTPTVTGLLTATTWSTCSGAGRLQYDLYRGGSHHWPEGSAATPPAQALIASFLLGRPSPATAATGASH